MLSITLADVCRALIFNVPVENPGMSLYKRGGGGGKDKGTVIHTTFKQKTQVVLSGDNSFIPFNFMMTVGCVLLFVAVLKYVSQKMNSYGPGTLHVNVKTPNPLSDPLYLIGNRFLIDMSILLTLATCYLGSGVIIKCTGAPVNIFAMLMCTVSILCLLGK
jgi:hypothetical protein